MEKVKEPTKVFISYSRDSEEHKTRVFQLANTLRKPWGIETDIDEYVRAKPPYTPSQGWDLWMEKRIEWAEFVLIVCTETYKRRFRGDEEPGQGRGVTWEGTIIRQHLYNNQLIDTKFIPVVFSSQDLDHVPLILNAHDKYIFDNEESFKTLVYRLRKEPIVLMPEVAVGNLPSPSQPEFFSHQELSIEPPPVSLDVAQIETSSIAQKETKQQAEREPAIDAVPLESEKGVDYRKLRNLLKAEKWREADEETLKVMLKAASRQTNGWLDEESLKTFPCKDLRTIDHLWVTASNGHFGFSVQKKIWEECGSPMDYSNYYSTFCDRVGWREREEWLEYHNLKFNPSISPLGELPARRLGRSFVRSFVWVAVGGVVCRRGAGRVFSFLAQRLVTCSI